MKKLAAVLLLASCAAPPPPSGAASPLEAVQAFAAAVADGRAGAAFALLSADTQRKADALAKQARDRSATGRPESGRQMLFGSALPGGKVTARLLEQSGDSARVEASEPGQPARVYRLVREGALWKIELDLGK